MATLLISDELRRSVNSSGWEPQFILRCHREISEDLRLAREINAMCARVTAIVDERETFVDEFDIPGERSVPSKMGEFMKQIPGISVSLLVGSPVVPVGLVASTTPVVVVELVANTVDDIK
ncbi:hypothetical protein Tco_1109277 [Tanacetum coccineum]